MPSEALLELARAPEGLLEEILEMRAFSSAKQIVDRAEKATDIPSTLMTDLVQAIEFELVLDRRRQRAADAASD